MPPSRDPLALRMMLRFLVLATLLNAAIGIAPSRLAYLAVKGEVTCSGKPDPKANVSILQRGKFRGGGTLKPQVQDTVRGKGEASSIRTAILYRVESAWKTHTESRAGLSYGRHKG